MNPERSKSFKCRLLSASALATVLSIGSAHAAGLPANGHYVAGTGTLNKAGRSLTVKQSSVAGIIDWNSFSVGSKNSVTFDNGSGATLNRVTGGNLSTIAGSLHATGSLYLMNSAGVIVSGTGHIVTGGSFVASSGDIANAAFGDGDRRFKPGAGNVVNKGTIVSGGSASLLGRNVSAGGTIHASSVDLSATDTLAVNGSITAHNGNGSGGAVIARAGTIVIGTDGDIDASASGSGQKGGTISVVSRGTTTVAGNLEANGGENGNGGFIETSGEYVHVADSAKISTLAANGKTGTWLIDPKDFTIAASGGDITGAALSAELATSDVDIQSSAGATSGHGDIFVDDAVSWSSGQMLTLDAYRSIDVNAPIAIGGAGVLALAYGDRAQHGAGNAANGDLVFSNGNIAFSDVASGNNTQLEINNQFYTLENTIADLANGIFTNARNGFYALADSYDASGSAAYSAPPIATVFYGTFEGLGNSISNLRITDNAGGDIGLFAETDGATLRDIALNNIFVTALNNVDDNNIGGLVGLANNTTIDHAHVTGTMLIGSAPSGDGPAVGGLAGDWALTSPSTDVSSDVSIDAGDNARAGSLAGLISGTSGIILTDSHAAGDVIVGMDGSAGGFASEIDGISVTGSSATGMVSSTGGGDVGGFAGTFNATASNDYATGDVFDGQGANGNAGGFAGVTSGSLDHSWASGNVQTAGARDGNEIISGGFVGVLENGSVTNSFATGNVTSGNTSANMIQGGFVGFMGSGTISDSYATGTVRGNAVGASAGGELYGGFAGYIRGAISKSYETGAVIVSGPAKVGGFVGQNDPSATVDESYEFGKVTVDASAIAGGFAGDNENTSGIGATVADYYNKTANTFGGVGNDVAPSSSDVSGITAANMFKKSSYAGWSFGTKGGDAGWVIVDSDASLNNQGGEAGGTLPMLLAEYSKTITNAHQLELVNLNLSADYTLGNFIDASGTAGGDVWSPRGFVHIGGDNYTTETAFIYGGTFDGRGNVIEDLTQKNTSDAFGGLFYGLNSGGTLENIGLVNVLIDNSALSGGSDGVLVAGFSNGTLNDDYTTGILRSGAGGFSGGLVGANEGMLTNSYSTVAVSGTVATSGGGLAGINGGTITKSYATGNVTVGDDSYGGGLTGFNDGGTINTSYSTGTVGGSTNGTTLGAFAGQNTGTITASYFNKSNNGSLPGIDTGSSAGVRGLTSAQMLKTSNFVGWTFGGLDSGNDWVIVDADSSLNNAGSASGGTAPMLLDEYSTTIANAHQLQLIALDLGANYTVSNDIDAGGTAQGDVWSSAGFVPLGSLSGFSGNFDGEGHAISGLTIAAANNSTVGLFGDALAHATIGDVSLTGMSVSSSATGSVGGLIGYNQGAVYDVSVAGTVNGTAGDQFIGGVTGTNSGSIFGSQSSATITSTQNNSGGAAGGISGANVGFQAWDSASGTVSVDGDLVAAGGLDGINAGLIENSSASGSVDLTDAQTISGNGAGGLVGINDGGTIEASYATTAVTASGGGEAFAGGFTGINENGGVISNSYALGSAAGSTAGGFVGWANGGSIKYSYATGAVHGAHVNGFAGTLQGAPTFSRDYWDTATSGVSSGNSQGISGESTAGLQNALRNGFGAANWSIVAGASFPYLNWQFLGDTPQVVSGNIYAGYGQSAAPGESVQIDSGGLELSTALNMASAANGYFYVLLNPSSYFDSGASLLVYGGGATLVDNINTNTVGGLRIYNGYLNDAATEDSYSGFESALASTEGSDGKAFDATLANLLITVSGSFFDVDESISHLQDVVIDAATGSSVNESGAISADGLLLVGDGNFTLTGANHIATLAANTDQSVDVTSDALTIGTVAGQNGLHAGGGVQLTTTHGAIDITRALIAASGHPIALDSAGAIIESGSGFIRAQQLSGSAAGNVELDGQNAIKELEAFSGRASKTFSLVDTKALDVVGELSGFGDADLATLRHGSSISIDGNIAVGRLDLVSSGAISETGAIDAATLLGSSTGSAVLTGGNIIANLDGFASGGAFSLTDDHSLTVSGAVSTKASDNMHLTTLNGGQNIVIDAKIAANDIYLVSAGAISEGGKGQLDAAKLLGSATAGANLNSAINTVSDLGAFTTGGELKLIDNDDLTVTGALNAGTSAVDLTTVGADHDLAIKAAITAGTVNLTTTGEATETKSGAIVTNLLNVTAATGIDLTSKKNTIQKLGTDKTTTGPNKVSL